MKKNLKIVLSCLLFTIITACSETKEIKVEEKPAVAVEPDKDVNVKKKKEK